MKLNLTRPLAVFDLETTGTNVGSDRIVEISIIKIHPDGNEEVMTRRINPGVPIPAEVTAIHGITDEDVKDEPAFAELAPAIMQFLTNCDMGGYNSNKFDVPLLVEEFLRADFDFDLKGRRFVDVQNIFHKMEPRTLKAAYRFYCDRNLENAHSAEADTRATYEILKAQLDYYSELENDIEQLATFTKQGNSVDFAGRIVYNDAGIEVFNFGKYKGVPVVEALKKEPTYFAWMLNGDFPLYTKKVLTAIKLRTAFNKVIKQ